MGNGEVGSRRLTLGEMRVFGARGMGERGSGACKGGRGQVDVA